MTSLPPAADAGAHARLTAAVDRIDSARLRRSTDARPQEEQRSVDTWMVSAEGTGPTAARDVADDLKEAIEGVKGARFTGHDCQNDAGGLCEVDEEWPPLGRGRDLP